MSGGVISKHEFAERLWQIMRTSGYYPVGLARASGVSLNTVYNWLNARSLPRVYELCKVREVLHCTWDELLG